jgi:hypothetical protein
MRDVIAIPWKSEPGRAYFSDVSKWITFTFTLKLHDTVKAENTQLKSLRHGVYHMHYCYSKGTSLTDWHFGSPASIPDWCLQTKCVYEILRPPTSNCAFPLTRSLTTLSCYQNSKLRCMLLMHIFADMTSKFIPSILTVHRLSSAACSKQSTYHHFAVEDKESFRRVREIAKGDY